jgi:hypothetical protein
MNWQLGCERLVNVQHSVLDNATSPQQHQLQYLNDNLCSTSSIISSLTASVKCPTILSDSSVKIRPCWQSSLSSWNESYSPRQNGDDITIHYIELCLQLSLSTVWNFWWNLTSNWNWPTEWFILNECCTVIMNHVFSERHCCSVG